MRLTLTTGAMALLVAGHAIAAQVLRVAVQEDSTPKFVARKAGGAGQVAGICPDILRAIEKQVPGLRFVFDTRAQPLRRIVSGMEQGELDANCLVDNTDRRTRFQVLPVALFSFDYHLIARAGDAVQIAGWDDVRRLGANGKILTLSGTGVMENLHKLGGLTVEESGKSPTVNLRKLVMGRGRFFYYRTHDWNSLVKGAMVSGQVRILPVRMESVRFYLMFGRHVERAAAVRAERAVRELDANGALAALRAKWQLDPAAPR